MSIALIEEVVVKSCGRISLAVRCPFCQSRHFHDLGYIQKEYQYPCSVRHSVCDSNLEIPYHLVILQDKYPQLVIQYYSNRLKTEDYTDLLKYVLRTRLKVVIGDKVVIRKPKTI